MCVSCLPVLWFTDWLTACPPARFFPFGVVFVDLCFILLLERLFSCIWVFTSSLLTHLDRTDQPSEDSAENKPVKMGPAGRLFNIRQGDGKIEEYARHFLGVVRRSATEKTCLMVIFWGGLAEPFKSRMPYWVPEESLEDYINLAMNLSGLALRVELAAQPAPVQEPTESAPEPALFREPMESTPEPAPLQSPLRSVSPRSPLHSGSPRNPLLSRSPRSPLRSGSPLNPLKKPLLSSGGYLLHPGGILLCWPRLGLLLCLPHPGTPVCLFLQALFHSTGPPLLPQIS